MLPFLLFSWNKSFSKTYFNVIPIHWENVGKLKKMGKKPHSISGTPNDNDYYMWLDWFLINIFNDIVRIIFTIFVVGILITLLKYNLHIVLFTHFKCTDQLFLGVYMKFYNCPHN